MSSPVTATTEQSHQRRNLIDAYVESPFAGIAPWVVMSLVTGPGRFELSVCLALLLSLLTFVISRRKGGSFKLMEIFDLLFFIGFAFVGLFANPAQINWLENWSGEITNVALTLFVVITILVRQPFTLQYARETTPREFWDSPAFLHINYTISWVWAAAFAFQSLSGGFGDLVLDNSNNYWTGWVLQIGALIFAFAFTEFYPDYAAAEVRNAQRPSLVTLFQWVPPFVLVVGIAGMLLDMTTNVIGVVLIVIGAIGMFWVSQNKKSHKTAAS